MSLESWKREFYPVEANQVSKEEAVEHSIRKWRGLTKTALKKHNLAKNNHDAAIRSLKNLFADLRINTSTCALCAHYFNKDEDTIACVRCPLYLVRERIRCDCFDPVPDSAEDDPYHAFTRTGNPRPMLKWLRRALKWEKPGQRQKNRKAERGKGK